jgi:superfamily II RNA helicase
VQIIGLSATIDTPETFAAWLGKIKKKNIVLVKKYDRPVPLEFSIYDGTDLHTMLDINNTYNANSFYQAIHNLKEVEKHHNDKKTNKVNSLMNNFIKYAKEKELIQLCFIVFSKKNCEKFAETVSIQLVDLKESMMAIKELEKKMGIHLKSYETMPRYRQIKNLIQKGIAFHHAGIPVILKEVIEYLYKNGFIKVLFSTETIAVGVNMPIRTICLTSIEKSDGLNVRSLNAAEFKQICGRAGRRGLDKKGLIVFLPLYEITSEYDFRTSLLFGSLPKIESKMELTYHSFLKILRSDVTNENNFFNDSLLSLQNNKMISVLSNEVKNIKEKYELSKLELNDFITKNKITKNIINEINEYIKLGLMQDQNKNNDFGDIIIKMNKQQISKKKKLHDTVKNNNKLYDLTINVFHLEEEIKKTENLKKKYLTYKDDRCQNISNFLKTLGYLDNESITQYGIMVTNINECNPFILTEIFTGTILQKLNPKQIVCLLSILTDKIQGTNKVELLLTNVMIDPIVKESIQYLESRIKNYTDVENDMKLLSDENYWDISYDYLEITKLWTEIDLSKEDHSRILQKLEDIDEYEGTFIKNILKINNIVTNLISLCNLTKNLDLLPVLQEIEPIIIKGMVNADSLHVTLV